MMKRCIYCKIELEENSVVDICPICMYKVWGPKMASAIVSGMEIEKEKGNLELGRVSEFKEKKEIVIENKIVEELPNIEDSFCSEIVEQLPKNDFLN